MWVLTLFFYVCILILAQTYLIIFIVFKFEYISIVISTLLCINIS